MTTHRLVSLAVLAAVLAGGAPASADTLEEALSAAYESNPELRAQRAALRALDENIAQAHSNYRPTVKGQAGIDRSHTESQTGNDPSNSLSVTTKTYSAEIDQPIFRGFQTYNQSRQAKSQIEAGRAQLEATEHNTMLAAVTAYMDVLRDEAVLELNDNQVQVLQRQLEASQDRFRVGEITRTDVAQSEARLAAAKSSKIDAEAALAVSREAYRRVIGQAPGTLEQPPALTDLPASIEDAISAARDENPVLQAARYDEKAAEYAVYKQKGALLPSVAASARISRQEGQTPYFNGVNLFPVDRTTTTKSVGATLTVPLYQSGAEYSAVRQAKQLRSQRMLEIAATERQVIERVRNAWEQLRAARANIASNESSLRANEVALDGVRQEAAVGSRTTLDVLNAEQELLDSQVNLVRSKRNEYVAAFSLLASIGRLGARDLNLNVDYYDPAENYDDVKWKFFGFGSGDGE